MDRPHQQLSCRQPAKSGNTPRTGACSARLGRARHRLCRSLKTDLRMGAITEWLFVEAPQRQSATVPRVGRTFPFVSCSSTVPVITYGPFGFVSIITSAISNSPPCDLFLIGDCVSTSTAPYRTPPHGAGRPGHRERSAAVLRVWVCHSASEDECDGCCQSRRRNVSEKAPHRQVPTLRRPPLAGQATVAESAGISIPHAVETPSRSGWPEDCRLKLRRTAAS